MPKKYDVAIIGSGPGGYVSAIRLRQLDKNVCVIDVDEDQLGGVCLNEGCIPVKSLMHTSRLYFILKKAEEYGIEAIVKKPDMRNVVARSQDAVLQLRNGLKGLFKKYGIEFIAGKAKIGSRNKIKIKLKDGEEEELEASKIIIATGSSPKVHPYVKIDKERIITSREAIRLKKIPKTLLIIGAGPVGVEFCSLFSTFDSKVTLVDIMSDILPSEDEEISKALVRIFQKRGIDVFTNIKVKSLNKKNGSVEAVFDVGGAERKMKFESVLIAIGRKPNTEDIGLEDAGIKMKDGFIVVNEKMRTNIDNIYGVGDVLNTPMYAHVAYKEGLIAAEDIAGIKTEPIDYENVPRVVFSEPQVASVGLTESEAKARGYVVAISKQFFKANGLAIATHQEEGFMKIIVDNKTRAILGVHIIGSNATEILHEFVIAKNSNLKIDDIAKAVHAHPTFSEIAVDAARAVFGKPIHGN